MPYSVAHDPDAPGHVIVVSGDADVTTAADLEECMVEAVTSGARLVTVDLSEAALIDSRTIGVLVGWTERLGSAGGALPIVCPNPNIRRMFTSIGLDQSLSLVSSRGEAASVARS